MDDSLKETPKNSEQQMFKAARSPMTSMSSIKLKVIVHTTLRIISTVRRGENKPKIKRRKVALHMVNMFCLKS